MKRFTDKNGNPYDPTSGGDWFGNIEMYGGRHLVDHIPLLAYTLLVEKTQSMGEAKFKIPKPYLEL